MLHIMGITVCKKWACSFIQVLIVFVLIVANSGLSLGETNEASSTSQAEAVATKRRISGDEESKDKLMESTDQKKSRDWTSPTPLDASLLPEAIDQKNSYSWSSLNASFLSTEAIGQEKPVKSGDDLAAVAQKTNNPVSDLWMFFFQYDFTTYDGSSTEQDRKSVV